MSTNTAEVAPSFREPAHGPQREAGGPTHPRSLRRVPQEPAARALRRSRAAHLFPYWADRREGRYRTLLAATVLLAALIPVTAAVGVQLAESALGRLIVGCTVLIVAGLAVAASSAATSAATSAHSPDPVR
jgi:predicted alpha/beta-hydrolase family hydrolase